MENWPDGTGLLGDAERAKFAQATCDGLTDHGRVTWRDILYAKLTAAFAEKDIEKLYSELLSTEKTLLNWIYDLENRIEESRS